MSIGGDFRILVDDLPDSPEKRGSELSAFQDLPHGVAGGFIDVREHMYVKVKLIKADVVGSSRIRRCSTRQRSS